MELYAEAVTLALTFDVGLAMKAAEAPRDRETRKSLWLHVLRHLVEERRDMKACGPPRASLRPFLSLPPAASLTPARAMACLQQSALLTIDDILRYISDGSPISAFADEICAALEDSNRRVQALKGELQQAERRAQVIRDDLKKMRQLRATLDPHRLCDLSHLPLQGRPFAVFPNGCCFLTTALQEELAFCGIALPLTPDGELKEAGLENPFYSTEFIEATGRGFEAPETERESWTL